MRVIGPAKDRIVGFIRNGHFRRVRLAENDRARSFQPLHNCRVAIRNTVCAQAPATGPSQASTVKPVLYCYPYAPKPAKVTTPPLNNLATSRPVPVAGTVRDQRGYP